MIFLEADSALDLRISAPHWVDQRATLCTPSLAHFDPEGGLLQFFTNCSGSGNTWIQTIVFKDWTNIINVSHPWEVPIEGDERAVDPGDTWPTVLSKVPDIINMDIQVHCNCPAFLWWGSQYNLETRDTALYDEGVPYPHIRDPSMNNIICKHLAAVFDKQF